MDGTIGEIRAFAGNFAPRNWKICNGQLLSISQYQALFSIIGATYGGDARTNFAVPNLVGRTPIGFGTGPGLSTRNLGEMGGTETNTLVVTQMPAHTHNATGSIKATNAKGTTSDPSNAFPAHSNCNIDRSTNIDVLSYGSSSNVNMNNDGLSINIGATGSNQPINNMQPYLAITWIICVNGEYPSRD